MILHCYRKRFLRDILADHVLVEHPANFLRLWNTNVRRLPPRVFVQLLVENAFADVDATVANVNARTGNEFAHLGVALTTERAHREVRRARHILPSLAASIPPTFGRPALRAPWRHRAL